MLFPLKVAFEYDPLVDIGAGPQPGIVCCLGAHVTFLCTTADDLQCVDSSHALA